MAVSLKAVKKQIKALHIAFDSKIPEFKAKPHTDARDDAMNTDDVKKARGHLKKMLKAVRAYYEASRTMQVGVVIPAQQLIQSIMARMGGGGGGAGTTAPATPNPTASATPSASTATPTPTPPASVKAHPGDVLRKKGDRFGHAFSVSTNYRNSGMEAYQRRGVGRHEIVKDGPPEDGNVKDPVIRPNIPRLALRSARRPVGMVSGLKLKA